VGLLEVRDFSSAGALAISWHPQRFQPVALLVENIHFFGFVLSIPWLDKILSQPIGLSSRFVEGSNSKFAPRQRAPLIPV
jgi:hypothetical protein